MLSLNFIVYIFYSNLNVVLTQNLNSIYKFTKSQSKRTVFVFILLVILLNDATCIECSAAATWRISTNHILMCEQAMKEYFYNWAKSHKNQLFTVCNALLINLIHSLNCHYWTLELFIQTQLFHRPFPVS